MFVPAEVHNLLVACLDRFLAVRMMGVEGCSEDRSSAERPVCEIPRRTLPHMRQRSGSPVGCSVPYIACWSRWVGRIYQGDVKEILNDKYNDSDNEPHSYIYKEE